jgi:hypothetical protein
MSQYGACKLCCAERDFSETLARGLCTPSQGTLPGLFPVSYPFDTGYFFSANKAKRTVKLTIHLNIILPASII